MFSIKNERSRSYMTALTVLTNYLCKDVCDYIIFDYIVDDKYVAWNNMMQTLGEMSATYNHDDYEHDRNYPDRTDVEIHYLIMRILRTQRNRYIALQNIALDNYWRNMLNN